MTAVPAQPRAPDRPATSFVPIVALFLVATAFRPPLVGIGPLLPLIRSELAMDYSVAGLLTTIPVLCLGILAPFGPWLAHRLGPRNALAACVLGNRNGHGVPNVSISAPV